MINKIIPLVTLVSAILLVTLINTTTPASAGPLGILGIFIFAYLLSLGVVTYFIYGVSRVVAHLSSAFTVRKPIQALPIKRSYYYATVVAAAPIMLVGLQSVGAIGVYEVALVLLFVVIGCLYITKRIS